MGFTFFEGFHFPRSTLFPERPSAFFHAKSHQAGEKGQSHDQIYQDHLSWGQDDLVHRRCISRIALTSFPIAETKISLSCYEQTAMGITCIFSSISRFLWICSIPVWRLASRASSWWRSERCTKDSPSNFLGTFSIKHFFLLCQKSLIVENERDFL